MNDVTVGKRVFYVKPDGKDHYFLGCAPVIYVKAGNQLFEKGHFDAHEVDEIGVFVDKDDNGSGDYTLSLVEGQFMNDMKEYILKLNSICYPQTGEKNDR